MQRDNNGDGRIGALPVRGVGDFNPILFPGFPHRDARGEPFTHRFTHLQVESVTAVACVMADSQRTSCGSDRLQHRATRCLCVQLCLGETIPVEGDGCERSRIVKIARADQWKLVERGRHKMLAADKRVRLPTVLGDEQTLIRQGQKSSVRLEIPSLARVNVDENLAESKEARARGA